MRFIYNQDIKGIYKVELSLYTEDNKHYIFDMSNCNGRWQLDLNTLSGEEGNISGELRYKYLLNDGIIRLNDPVADHYVEDCYGEIWSVRISQKFSIKERTNAKLKNFLLTDRVTQPRYCKRIKRYDYKECVKIAACLDVENIKGVHNVTFIWYQPDGRIYRIEERSLTVFEVKPVNAQLWFWINTGELDIKYMRGIWEVDVFVDGKKEIKDNFILKGNLCDEYIGFMAQA